jgi:hypothetical protein
MIATALAVLGVLGCLRTPDPVERDLESIKERSVPPGGRMTVSYPLSREQGTAGREGPDRRGLVRRAALLICYLPDSSLGATNPRPWSRESRAESLLARLRGITSFRYRGTRSSVFARMSSRFDLTVQEHRHAVREKPRGYWIAKRVAWYALLLRSFTPRVVR